MIAFDTLFSGRYLVNILESWDISQLNDVHFNDIVLNVDEHMFMYISRQQIWLFVCFIVVALCHWLFTVLLNVNINDFSFFFLPFLNTHFSFIIFLLLLLLLYCFIYFFCSFQLKCISAEGKISSLKFYLLLFFFFLYFNKHFFPFL